MQILTDIHTHTIASSHAYSTLQEMLQASKAKGLEALAITDHAPPMPDSPHWWHFINTGVIPRAVDGVTILRGMEANIEANGLNIPERVQQKLDLTIASFHEPVFAPQDKLTNTRTMISAIESGLCQIIGHPGNPKFPIEVDTVIQAAKAANVVLEINNSSLTLSRAGSACHCHHLLKRVAHHDWKVSFGSDAHISYTVGEFDQAIALAQSIDFPEKQIVNANLKRLLEFLGEHGKGVKQELASLS